MSDHFQKGWGMWGRRELQRLKQPDRKKLLECLVVEVWILLNPFPDGSGVHSSWDGCEGSAIILDALQM